MIAKTDIAQVLHFSRFFVSWFSLLGTGKIFTHACASGGVRKIAPRSGSGFGLGLALELGLGAIFLGGNFLRTASGIRKKWMSSIKKQYITPQSNFIEITLRHGCSPINLLHIFRTPFPRNTSGRLLLHII